MDISPTIHLHNVLSVPQVSFNLFSVSKLTQSLNSVTIFFIPSLLGLRDKDADWSR